LIFSFFDNFICAFFVVVYGMHIADQRMIVARVIPVKIIVEIVLRNSRAFPGIILELFTTDLPPKVGPDRILEFGDNQQEEQGHS